MGKGKDSKKSVKKEATKTPKEKKAEKRLKKNSHMMQLLKERGGDTSMVKVSHKVNTPFLVLG